jgi:hypothetical protein
VENDLGIAYLIFGHFHRPLEIALFPPADVPRFFILGDWLTSPTYLRWDGNKISSHAVTV